ncbi:MBL fold metallo-hydrolase [Oceanirhabdus sp. W0125-5]|uniref:MBL fold metallo-hydrolase n=1 Tax=Oceanirhabdus sp. W0125-5 TaxID=2999116 RepID=UPI0022F33B6F|nr:MBL fold metallo-hydrolase [Oceanirhabdus sp. W0125-5]WBW96883.1 MBL fold metallo-hydrolase [Oceanirhabdus sp. W0125-5]
MKDLFFTGIGSAFNPKLGNNSAFIKKNKNLILIDCGGTVFSRLQELNMLDRVDKVYIIITHTHPDHVGSLGEVIFYLYNILKKKATVIYPNKEFIQRFLSNIGATTKQYYLESENIVKVDDDEFGEFSIEFLPVSHVKTIPCYGFIMNIEGESFYYSGDSNNIENRILMMLKNGELHRVYQDTCGLDYKGNAHISLRKLKELISIEYRNKVYCMHLDQHITRKDIEESGFNVVEQYNGF